MDWFLYDVELRHKIVNEANDKPSAQVEIL